MGLESLHTRDVRHTHRLLIRHILALRAVPMFSTAMLVFIFESNLAFEAQHLLHAVQNYRDDHGRGITNWVSLSEGQQQAHGWLTTNERKVPCVPTHIPVVAGQSSSAALVCA